jgi:uncharacterized protein (TIGR03905 family)
MHHSYRTKGVCSRQIDFELKDGKVYGVSFLNGCEGSLKGISALIDGMDAGSVIERVKNIKCGGKPTSCPMQLAAALSEAREKDMV